jgi:hypothetical protein
MYKKIIELIKLQINMVSFDFLSKAAPKCRCFSLAQRILWWWGSQRKIQSIGVGNVL